MSKLTDLQLLGWVQRLSPDAGCIAGFEDNIQKWQAKKASSGDQYDSEICGFHIESLRAQIELIQLELQAQTAVEDDDLTLLRALAVKHSTLSEKVSKLRIQIYSIEQVDKLVGKQPLRI